MNNLYHILSWNQPLIMVTVYRQYLHVGMISSSRSRVQIKVSIPLARLWWDAQHVHAAPYVKSGRLRQAQVFDLPLLYQLLHLPYLCAATLKWCVMCAERVWGNTDIYTRPLKQPLVVHLHRDWNYSYCNIIICFCWVTSTASCNLLIS